MKLGEILGTHIHFCLNFLQSKHVKQFKFLCYFFHFISISYEFMFLFIAFSCQPNKPYRTFYMDHLIPIIMFRCMCI